MTDLVLDASVALSWCFKSEATTAADRVLERLADEAAAVPAIWHLEIANVLALSERRGRITPAHSSEFIALLGKISLTTFPAAVATFSASPKGQRCTEAER